MVEAHCVPCAPVAPVNLGFIATDDGPTDPFHKLGYSQWDGGKVGGRPFNLHPSSPLPTAAATCPKCSSPCRFLLQIYAPADDAVGPSAFHRMLYVFACEKTGCPGARAVRAQAGRSSVHFVESCDEVPGNEGRDEAGTYHPGLCAVCGLRSDPPLRCPEQGTYFCGRGHQVEHMKRVTKRVRRGEPPEPLRCVFPEMCIVVEDERGGGGGAWTWGASWRR